jgi:hypothetical protein
MREKFSQLIMNALKAFVTLVFKFPPVTIPFRVLNYVTFFHPAVTDELGQVVTHIIGQYHNTTLITSQASCKFHCN